MNQKGKRFNGVLVMAIIAIASIALAVFTNWISANTVPKPYRQLLDSRSGAVYSLTMPDSTIQEMPFTPFDRHGDYRSDEFVGRELSADELESLKAAIAALRKYEGNEIAGCGHWPKFVIQLEGAGGTFQISIDPDCDLAFFDISKGKATFPLLRETQSLREWARNIDPVAMKSSQP